MISLAFPPVPLLHISGSSLAKASPPSRVAAQRPSPNSKFLIFILLLWGGPTRLPRFGRRPQLGPLLQQIFSRVVHYSLGRREKMGEVQARSWIFTSRPLSHSGGRLAPSAVQSKWDQRQV